MSREQSSRSGSRNQDKVEEIKAKTPIQLTEQQMENMDKFMEKAYINVFINSFNFILILIRILIYL